ncbi:PHB depolymerase family esterase [Sphingomonas albertensis]|uniref:PHB depolymerase family esterase n=1 Tax=Sphingomonas albertensis TaxID=2762591 RepID=A0ABR7AS54_9SPHN|nr:PHB depolymerase family esterase [Sphingomonas albertensis]MBC3942787.1 PHB depolymerase family esterase [Sphingomonas albertensis]
MRNIADTIARMARAGAPTPRDIAPSRLTPLIEFGTNPGALLGHSYVPKDLPPGAALVVVLHGCTQTAAGYDHGSGWSKLADRAGFALLFPEQTRANNPNLCFNWFASEDTAQAGGEAESIAQMSETMIARHGLDRSRVYVTGLSAGGAMTVAMLATRPDLFAGGAVIGGLAYGTATGVSQALDRMRGHGDTSDVALADAVRSGSRGHDGRWPTLAIWHGGADATVSVANADTIARQWRGIHGVDATAVRTERVGTAVHRIWSDAEGRDVVEDWTVPGMGHGTPIDPLRGERLGAAGPFMLDVGISSTAVIAKSWGLVAAAKAETAAKPAPVERVAKIAIPVSPKPAAKPASKPRAEAPTGIQATIEHALRAAGLMR